MKTYGWKSFQVSKHERALLVRNGDVERLLPAGRHRVKGWGDVLSVARLSGSESAFDHPLAEQILDAGQRDGAGMTDWWQHLIAVRLADDEVGLLIEDDLLTAVLPPGTRRLFWKAPRPIRVETVSLLAGVQMAPALVARLQPLMARAGTDAVGGVLLVQVPQHHAGLLRVDGVLQPLLSTGVHGFWRFGPDVSIEVVDLRTQTTEVGGQEILSRDKVSLRLNLLAGWRYQDVARAFAQWPQPADQVYRELQFALRAVVGAQTLDGLLSDKAQMDAALMVQVGPRLAAHGIVLESVGVKDIILPGEMRTLLAKVVEAEKAAQANLIRRREETAATRSLLNTAKVMEDNPVALRMKELETLERVAERIDRISVVGGLDQVLDGLVKLRPAKKG
ncbi:MAG: slipin family protein [Lautropia sp.]|nr:slipin family protein [Lautropia sp.]